MAYHNLEETPETPETPELAEMMIEYNYVAGMVQTLTSAYDQIETGLKAKPLDIHLVSMHKNIAHDLEMLAPHLNKLAIEINARLNIKINPVKAFKFIPVKAEQK
jgi:hypothetical protein